MFFGVENWFWNSQISFEQYVSFLPKIYLILYVCPLLNSSKPMLPYPLSKNSKSWISFWKASVFAQFLSISKFKFPLDSFMVLTLLGLKNSSELFESSSNNGIMLKCKKVKAFGLVSAAIMLTSSRSMSSLAMFSSLGNMKLVIFCEKTDCSLESIFKTLRGKN